MARSKKFKPVVKPDVAPPQDGDDKKVVEQPKVDENGVKIEQSVFPPPDPDSFHGTSAANRQYRLAQETNEENENK